MKLILRNNTDPFFNIAAEEYFLKNYSEDIIMLWQNSSSVVVGKHQNTMAEVNMSFVHKHNIPVIRRISGGGTVYHDEGNINYSIITSSENKEKLVDFRKATVPVIGFLDSLGLVAVFEGKNNLTINNKKFSGNSAHVFKNRVLHHGTILFNTDLNNLEASIRLSDYNIDDKSVKSIRANVTNLEVLLLQQLSIEEFMNLLKIYFSNYFNIESISQISSIDVTRINELVENKYKQWDWNYGYSPAYVYRNEVNKIILSMKINKGIIDKLNIEGQLCAADKICNDLIDCQFKREVIESTLEKIELNKSDLNLYMSLFGLN